MGTKIKIIGIDKGDAWYHQRDKLIGMTGTLERVRIYLSDGGICANVNLDGFITSISGAEVSNTTFLNIKYEVI